MSASRSTSISGREWVPVDSVAARVTSPGVHFNPDKRLQQEIWEAPPECDPMPNNLPDDLSGTRRGRVVIVRYFGRTESGKHAWLARCVCGKYEIREGASWRRGLRKGKDDLGCQYCNHHQYLKRNDEYHRLGRNVNKPTHSAA